MSPLVVLPPALPKPAPVALPRRIAAGVLLAASRLLDRLAQHLAAAPVAVAAVDVAMPHIEYHAEAGAPEGALYVDGKFVAYVPGVARL